MREVEFGAARRVELRAQIGIVVGALVALDSAVTADPFPLQATFAKDSADKSLNAERQCSVRHRHPGCMAIKAA